MLACVPVYTMGRISNSSRTITFARKFLLRCEPHITHRITRIYSSANIPANNSERQFWTTPNIITLSRIATSPLIAVAIASDMKVFACAICATGAFSDWLDGYIAKNYNQKVCLCFFITYRVV